MNHRPEPDPGRLTGILAAIGAFGIWGGVPVFFKLLGHVDSGAIIAHRIVWTLVIISLWLAVRDGRRLRISLALSSRTILALGVSAALVAINWYTFVWAVNHGQVMATSLGYFINPLVSVLLGVVFLGERLSRAGWLAVALAAAGTAWMGWGLGQPPWLALILAFSFGAYGLVRKWLGTGPLVGLWWEAVWLIVPALAYLAYVDGVGLNLFAPYDAYTAVLLVVAGLLTLVPLALFALAANRLPLSTVGFFQYLAPTLSLILAVFLYHEPFTTTHGISFALIWTGLAVFTLANRRR